MSANPLRVSRIVVPESSGDSLELARSILVKEAAAIEQLAQRIDYQFCSAIDRIIECRGNVIVTGMGKAGLIGQKIAATLSSTGTPSHFLHPAEAIHGDLGRVQSSDIVIVLSFSGETEEITRLLPCLRKIGCQVIAMTAHDNSSLAVAANCTLLLGSLEEAGPLGLAPSTSTTAMLALGDALALVLAQERRFEPEDFAQFHPGGSLGRKLALVEDLMRPWNECRIALQTQTVREVLVTVSHPGRRTGAIMLVDAAGVLQGLFTDSDLARLFEDRREYALDEPVSDVMTLNPTMVKVGARIGLAIEMLAEHKISELPVVDAAGCPQGMIDITDVVKPTNDDPDTANTSSPIVPFPRR